MQQLNLISGKTKEQIAIEFIQEHEPEEGYFLGFSGGKDSVVLYDLAVKSGVKFQGYYSATGIDAPEVVKFIKTNYPEVIFCRPKESFFKSIPKKGYPQRVRRWCCNTLKKDPAKNIPLKHRLVGLRAEESYMRARRPIIDSYYTGQILYKPIFQWLEWEIWDHIYAGDIPYCSLYDEGFSRLGCVVCPFVIGKNAEKNKTRWPKIYKAFEIAMRKLWDEKQGTGKSWDRWDTFDEFLANWYKGK